ncbi:hypothetical protein MMC22_006788 [Lobaria immixta]|nr:hypothetical protein [Lobaria immixta]
MTIKFLGSNEKKEQFFKEFEMTTHLAEFYERQGRSAELFQLLIEDGQLRPALDAASKSHTRSHEHEIETAFNLLHVQKLFWEQSTELGPSIFPSDWKDTLPHSLVSASADWNAVSRILNLVKKGQMCGALAEVQNEIIKECLCLYIVLFLPDYIQHTTSISDLPIEIIKVVVALAQKLSSGNFYHEDHASKHDRMSADTRTNQASSAVTRAISILHSNQAYLTVGFGLENLLFHRIGKEWQDRSSLSSLLGQYEFSVLLGSEVNKNFLRAMRRNIGYCLGPEVSFNYMGDQLHELRMARQAVESFHQIRAAISESNENILHNNLRSFLRSFDTINLYSLSEFHAVTTSFEYIATFLLYARRPVQSIVLPHSWTILHLVPIIQLSSPKLAVSSQAERSRYTKHLLELVNHFSELLNYLDKSADKNFEFSCNGRRLPSSTILQRRNVELLAVIALNMGSERTLDENFAKIWDAIKAVFALRSSPVYFQHQSKFEQFVHTFVPSFNSYNGYNGKDWLAIIEFEDEQSHTGSMRQILDRGASRCRLQDVLSANSLDNTRRAVSANDLSASPFCESSYTEAQGKIISPYLNLVATCVPKVLSFSSTIRIRALFLTDVASLQFTLDAITQKLHQYRKVLSDLFADPTLSPSRLEALQEPWNAFTSHESTVAQLRLPWSTDHLRTQQWWFDPTELETALARDLEELRSIQEQLDMLEIE